MTVLSRPTTFNQIADPSPDHLELCGQCCAASIATDYTGKLHTPDECNAWLKAKGYDVSGGTSPYWLVDWLETVGVPCHVVTDAGGDFVLAALSRRHRSVALVADDSTGAPAAGAANRHWLEPYGDDGAGVHCMQPWGGTDISYAASEFEGGEQNLGIEVDAVMPADQPHPTPAPVSTQGGTMIAPRPDGSGADGFVKGLGNPPGSDGQLYTFELLADGSHTTPYGADPWKGHPIERVLGAYWQGQVLTVLVLGTDSNVYQTRYQGGWGPFVSLGFNAA